MGDGMGSPGEVVMFDLSFTGIEFAFPAAILTVVAVFIAVCLVEEIRKGKQ